MAESWYLINNKILAVIARILLFYLRVIIFRITKRDFLDNIEYLLIG